MMWWEEPLVAVARCERALIVYCLVHPVPTLCTGDRDRS